MPPRADKICQNRAMQNKSDECRPLHSKSDRIQDPDEGPAK